MIFDVRCDVEIVSSSKIGTRLASPFTGIFFQTIFNMSHLRTLAFSAKDMCNNCISLLFWEGFVFVAASHCHKNESIQA